MKHTERMIPTLGTAFAPVAAMAIAASVTAAPLVQDIAAPPQPDRDQSLISPVGGYAIMALFFAVIVMVSLIPSKRGAQD